MIMNNILVQFCIYIIVKVMLGGLDDTNIINIKLFKEI